MDWVIGLALLVVVGVAGTYGVRAVATPSPSTQVTRSDGPVDSWGRVPEDVAEATIVGAVRAAGQERTEREPGSGARSKSSRKAGKDLPGLIEVAPKRDRDDANPTVQVVVSSFNVLGSSHTAGHGRGKRARASGAARAGAAARLISGNGVGIVGLQELQWDQAAVLANRLPGYGIYPGRSMGPRNAENSIAWRLDMFDVVDARTLTIPYFRGNPRQMPYVKLRSRANDQELWVLNVHHPASTPRWGNNARWRRVAVRRELDLVRSLRQAEPDVPVLLTGDMNDRAAYFCPVVGSGLLRASNGGSAAGGACRLPAAPQIDWIMGTPDTTWSGYVVDRSGLVRWTSDHPMVRAVLTLEGSDAVSEAADALAALGD